MTAGSIEHYSFETICQVVSEAQTASISEICKKYDITPWMVLLWQRQYADIPHQILRKLMFFEQNNRILKSRLTSAQTKIKRLEEIIEDRRNLVNEPIGHLVHIS